MAASSSSASGPVYNVLFSQPRTSSHLLTRILNLPAQPSVHPHPNEGYFFMQALRERFHRDLSRKHISTWTGEERHAAKEAWEAGAEEMENWLKEVEGTGRGFYIKQHVCWIIEPVSETKYFHGAQQHLDEKPWTAGTHAHERTDGNETILPDPLLRKLRPTFLIRHPALAFPSLLRTSLDGHTVEHALREDQLQRWEMNFHWTRALYTWYTTHLAAAHEASHAPDASATTYPLILDADDITSPPVVCAYAQAIGLDPALVQFQWEAATQEEIDAMPNMVKKMKKTLLKSTGVVQGKSGAGLVLEDEARKWEEEFGDVLAGRLKERVGDAMADYEWLRERRFRG